MATGDFSLEITLGMLVHQYKSEHFRAYLCPKNPKEILIFTTTPLNLDADFQTWIWEISTTTTTFLRIAGAPAAPTPLHEPSPVRSPTIYPTPRAPALPVPIRARTLTYIDFSPREYTGLLGRWELLKALTSVGKCPEQIYSRP